MANFIDDELYPDNDDLIVCRPTRSGVNAVTGEDEVVTLTGLTDLKAYLSATDTAETHADAIHADLVVALVEVGATGTYWGSLSGASKRAQLAGELDSAVLHRHWQSVTGGYHETKSVLYRTKRVAA